MLAVNDTEKTRQLKRKFAAALAQDPAEPMTAARVVWPYNTGYAIYVKQNWPSDPEIAKYVEAVHALVGTEGQLPTSDELALYLWKLASSAKDDDARLKYLRLYTEARGELKRPAGDNSGVVINQNRVMVVTNLGTDEQWGDTAEKQQKALQEKLVLVADSTTEAEVVELTRT